MKPKEGILVSADRDQFFYYKKSRDNEILIYPSRGITLPLNRSKRATKFARFNENIEVQIEDEIQISCTLPIEEDMDAIIVASRESSEGENPYSAFSYSRLKEGIQTVLNPAKETEMVANELKVFTLTTAEGFFFTTMDSALKTAQLSIVDDTGYIGQFSGRHHRRIMTILSLWPELKIRLTIRNGVTYIYVNPEVLHLESFKLPGIINIRRHFKNEMHIIQNYAET